MKINRVSQIVLVLVCCSSQTEAQISKSYWQLGKPGVDVNQQLGQPTQIQGMKVNRHRYKTPLWIIRLGIAATYRRRGDIP
jgi:hypothetical protein